MGRIAPAWVLLLALGASPLAPAGAYYRLGNLTESIVGTPAHHALGSADPGSDDPVRRRLEVLFQFHPRKHKLASPKYKEKTVKPEVVAWTRNVYFNAPGARHKRRRSAAYVSLTAKDFDPTVKALMRFAAETNLEVTTAAKLRAGVQREGSFAQPFHAALLVGPHVADGCVLGSSRHRRSLGTVSGAGTGTGMGTGTPRHKASCARDELAYFTVLRDPLRFAQDHFYRLSRKLAAELASMDWREERPGEFTPQHLLAIEAYATQQPRRLAAFNFALRQRPQHDHFLTAPGSSGSGRSTSGGSERGGSVEQAAHVVRALFH